MTNKKFFATGLATLMILSLVLFVPTKPAYAATFTIDSTGGDCSTIGVWDAKKRMCTLKFDLNGSIEITADGITLNGNRHTLTGDGSGIGVLVHEKTGVTVKNVIVKNFNFGIRLLSSNGNTLTSNVANSNILGIVVTGSDGNTLTGNTANSNNIGIYLQANSNGNTLTSNTANSNVAGIAVFDSADGNTLTSNTVNSNGDYGILVGEFSNGNTLTGNTVNSNPNGILVENSANTVVQKNTASLNIQNGFRLSADTNTILKGNTANSNGEFGYQSGAFSPSVGLAVSKNRCSGNGSGGSDPTGLCSPQP